jgi:hypothetical protein
MSAASCGSATVLQLVHEQDQRGAGAARRCPGRFEQRLQIVFEIAVVGEAWLRIEVHTDLDVLVLHLQCLGEAGQSTQRCC